MRNRALSFLAKILPAAAALFIAVAVSVILGTPAVSHAEPAGAELTPIESDSDIVYRYFDSPVSVFADPSGRLVAEKDKITAVSPNMEFSTVRNVSADKVYRRGETLYTLENGSLRSYYGDSVATFGEDDGDPDDDNNTEGGDNGGTTARSTYNFVDFTVDGDKLYALSTDALTVIPLGDTTFGSSGAVTTELFSYDHFGINATKTAVCGGNVFVAVDSPIFRNKQDVALVGDDGTAETVIPETDRVISLTAKGDSLFVLTRDAITAYSIGSGMSISHRTDDAHMTDIFAADDCLYALGSLDALYKISFDLTETTTLAASADDAEGFFNIPSGVAVKNSTLFVADAINGRIAAYGKSLEYVGGTFDNPISVASDSAGTLYVAHGLNKVSRIGSDETTVFEIDGSIKSIAVDADKNLYILSRSGLWYAEHGSSPVKVSDTRYKAITLGVGREGLFALDGAKVKRLTVNDGAVSEFDYVTASESAFSLAVDLGGNVFTLSRTGIDRYTRTAAGGVSEHFDLTLGGEPYELGFTSGQILLSTIGNEFTAYGDAVIVDSYKHRLFTVSGETLGVKLINGDDYEDPKLDEDIEPDFYGDGLIRTALYDTQVFSLPMETQSVYTIAKDRKVIVPKYDLPDTREYSLILIDNLATGELIEGYVYKDSLSEPLPYSAPPSNVGTVYSNATPVYKWPSPNAKTVKGFGAVERSTQFKVLDFVEPYRDDYDNLWYRVQIADVYEGFILAANLSLMDYEPVFIRPAYNAEIISYEESEFAPTYKLEDGEYVMLDVKLATGTKVEIIGVFDTSEQYTQVKYLDEKLGTLTCYVETVYLQYNGVNIVLIVAIAVIVVTVILAAVIIGRVLYVKKKRLITPTDERGDITE